MTQTLETRLLARLQAGETMDMATLASGANYDSVNRALGGLVKKRKAVRVGRGRYRLARGTSRSNDTIRDAVARKVSRSSRNVFLRSDFGGLGSYDGVGRALRQLIAEGRLVSVGYGLYAKAKVSPFTGEPAPVVGIRRLAREALSRLGKEVAPSGYEAAYNEKRSTQVPTGRAVTIKDRVSRRIGYDGKYVVFERA